MPNYRRAIIPGGSFFFTVVTSRRRSLFDRAECRAVLRELVERVRQKHPFSIDAWVPLPEHMHCIWTLPDGDSVFSKRWSLIQSGFSKRANIYRDFRKQGLLARLADLRRSRGAGENPCLSKILVVIKK